MDQSNQADSPAVEAVKAFLADNATTIVRERRSPWISPSEFAARLSSEVCGAHALHPGVAEAALRALAIPCVKIGGARAYLLAPVLPAAGCLTPASLLPTEVAVGLKVSLSGAAR